MSHLNRIKAENAAAWGDMSLDQVLQNPWGNRGQ